MSSERSRVGTDHPIVLVVVGAHRHQAATQLALLGEQLVLHSCPDLPSARAQDPDAVAVQLGGDAGDSDEIDLLATAAYALPGVFRVVIGPTGSEALVRRAVNEGRAEAYLAYTAGRAEMAATLRGDTGRGTARFRRDRTDDEDLGHQATIGELETQLAACQAQLVEAHERLRATRNEVLQLELQGSISQLVRGLAHELNNPLTAILGHTQRLRLRADDPADVKRRAGVLSAEAERCIALVERLRSLASPLSEAVTPCLLGTVVGMACERLEQRRVTPPPIGYRRELPPILAGQRALARCLEQIFDNAIQAGAGRIWIDGEVRSGRVTIWIDNDGTTISDDEIRHGIRPFFTTRSQSGHHGLGLSLASSLLREMGGSLSLDHQPDGEGARCTIILPGASGMQESSPSHGVAVLGSGVVLVVDDEPIVAELLGDLIGDLGYPAEICGDREAALDRLQSGDIRGVLCDVKLPDGNGIELVAKALRRWPALVGHCALITGDAGSPDIRAKAEELDVPLIAKPFHLAEVQRVLRELL